MGGSEVSVSSVRFSSDRSAGGYSSTEIPQRRWKKCAGFSSATATMRERVSSHTHVADAQELVMNKTSCRTYKHLLITVEWFGHATETFTIGVHRYEEV